MEITVGINTRFLIMLIVAILFGGSFCSRQITYNRYSLFEKWITSRFSRFLLEQDKGSSCKHEPPNDLLLVFRMNILLQDEFIAFEPVNGNIEVAFLLRQRRWRDQTEFCFDWNTCHLFHSSAAILYLLFALSSSLQAIPVLVIKAEIGRNDSQKGTYILINFTSLGSYIPHSREHLSSHGKETFFWLYDSIGSISRFHEYSCFPIYFPIFDRVASYRPLCSTPLQRITSFVRLAEAGFFYRGAGSAVECEGCTNVVDITDFGSPARDGIYHREGCSYVITGSATEEAGAELHPGRQSLIEPATSNEHLTTRSSSNIISHLGTRPLTGNDILSHTPPGGCSLGSPLSSNTNVIETAAHSTPQRLLNQQSVVLPEQQHQIQQVTASVQQETNMTEQAQTEIVASVTQPVINLGMMKALNRERRNEHTELIQLQRNHTSHCRQQQTSSLFRISEATVAASGNGTRSGHHQEREFLASSERVLSDRQSTQAVKKIQSNILLARNTGKRLPPKPVDIYIHGDDCHLECNPCNDIHDSSSQRTPISAPEESRSTVVDLLQREQQYLKQSLICMICNQNPIRIAFLPCGHFVACWGCSCIVTHCPLCEKKIMGTVTAFFI